MERPPAETQEELERRIRSLTTLLHEFMLQRSPSRQREDISPFLRHFTTLLTWGNKQDRDAKKVVAVAGSIAPNQQPWALIVAQNPYTKSLVEKIRLTTVEKDDRSLEAVVTGPNNPTFVQHVRDVLTALSAFDPRAANHTERIRSLELFFLSKSFRKFEVRSKEDSRLCGGKRLFEVIRQWQPDPNLNEIARKWVNPPGWLLEHGQIPKMNSRVSEGRVQWEFSDETKHTWSRILAIFLIKVEACIENVKAAKAKKGEKKGKGKKEDEEKEELHRMNDLNKVSGYLYSFVGWKAGIVKTLLTETNMVSDIAAVLMPTSKAGEDSDDSADLNLEPQESKGHQVFRYLRMVTAWHAAVNDLCMNPALPELLSNLVVGLVEVPPSPISVLSLEDVSREFFLRFPRMQESREAVLKIIQGRHKDKFSGCVHAEAILMGLMNYYNPSSTLGSRPLGEDVQDPEILEQLVQPVAETGNVPIAVSKKCCWCCAWLGKNLEADFTLPGTHGIMFPWDPPKIGISLSVLEELENRLWNELHEAVSSSLEPLYSRQSTSFGSPAMSPEAREADTDILSWVLDDIDL